jgi:quercetin dioxygenase-like cupin family protein
MNLVPPSTPDRSHPQHDAPVRRRMPLRAVAAAAALLATPVAVMGIAQATPYSKESTVLLSHASVPSLLKIDTKGASDVEIVKLTLRPGGTTGWHSHPGPVLISVRRGTLTMYRTEGHGCSRTQYRAGDSFVEAPKRVHTVLNEGGQDAVFYAIPIHPKGSPTGIDQPRPADCPS